MSAKSAVQLIARCREQVSDRADGEAFIRLLLKALTQEHAVRCVLLNLPIVSETALMHVTVLFAVLFARFFSDKELGAVILKRASFSPLPGIPSREIAHRYLDQLMDLLNTLEGALKPVDAEKEMPDAGISAEATLRSVVSQNGENLAAFEARKRDFLRVVEIVYGNYGAVGVKAENHLMERDWWFSLDVFPTLSQSVLMAVRQQIVTTPFRVTEFHLEGVETLLFAEGFKRLPEKVQHSVVRILPVLLLDGEAFDNLIWIITRNGFALSEDWLSHIDLVTQVDLLRCFILQGTEFLMQTSQMLSALVRSAQKPFWELLSLEALNRAAALSVGVDANRLKAVVSALACAPDTASARRLQQPRSVQRASAY